MTASLSPFFANREALLSLVVETAHAEGTVNVGGYATNDHVVDCGVSEDSDEGQQLFDALRRREAEVLPQQRSVHVRNARWCRLPCTRSPASALPREWQTSRPLLLRATRLFSSSDSSFTAAGHAGGSDASAAAELSASCRRTFVLPDLLA